MARRKPILDADEARGFGFFAGKHGYACLPPDGVTLPKASKKSFEEGWREGWDTRATTEANGG